MSRIILQYGQDTADSYCYINSDLITINDLKCHIANIFKIQSFLLVQNNTVLPPCEGVRLVRDGERIQVRPDILPAQPPAIDDNATVNILQNSKNEAMQVDDKLELDKYNTPTIIKKCINSKIVHDINKIKDINTHEPNKKIETLYQNDQNDTEHLLREEEVNTQLKLDKKFPSSGDVIVFQILKLLLTCTSAVSKYIVAQTLSFDATTRQTELLILEGFSEFENPQNNKSKEDGTVCSKKRIMNWKLLLNPRLICVNLK